VDCGAFDGDTLRDFLSIRNEAFRHFIAIEPDRLTFGKLSACVEVLAPALREKITLLNCAVGATRGTIAFDESGALSSRSSDAGASQVESLPITDVTASWRPVTYIKMDIEGAEFDALKGAHPVIETDKPVVAVCVYHTQRDLWRLPLYLHRMVPGYRFFLRCHEGDGWQTVAYAVPPERALQGRSS
jgi:FkbM family methyltransferase